MQETDSQSQEQATATKVASAPAKSRTLWGDAFKRLHHRRCGCPDRRSVG